MAADLGPTRNVNIFTRIGDVTGGLLQVDRNTSSFADLSKARIKVGGGSSVGAKNLPCSFLGTQ